MERNELRFGKGEDIHGSVKNSSFSTEREHIKSISGRKHAEGSFTVDVSCSCSTIRTPETSLAGKSRFSENIKIQLLDDLTVKRSSDFINDCLDGRELRA